MMRLIKRFWWVLAILTLVIVGVGYWQNKKNQTAVETIKPVKQKMTKSLEVSGNVDATEKVTIPYGTGRISWVGVKENEVVKKWQALAKMDTRTLQKQMEQYLNTFEKTLNTRDQSLDSVDYYNKDTVTLNDKRAAGSADADLQNSMLNVEIQDITIKQATIISPIEGIITKLDRPYAGVNSTLTDIIQVVNPKTIYFAAVVDEIDMASIKTGLPTKVNIDAFPLEEFTSVIESIDYSPSASKNGGTGYKIHIPIASNNRLMDRLRLGMNGSITITIEEKDNVWTLPNEVVNFKDGEAWVQVKLKDKVEERKVSIGMETEDLVEITGGLEPETLVVKPKKS